MLSLTDPGMASFLFCSNRVVDGTLQPIGRSTEMGKIEVKVQTEKRMNAITNLCIAIKHTAIALNRPPEVHITIVLFILVIMVLVLV